MASKFDTGFSGFTDRADAFMAKAPLINKIGEAGRVDRNLERQARRVEVADNTATEVQVVPALLQKEKQALLGYMPVEQVDKLDKPSQTKVFDLNYRNKNEGTLEELSKDSFEKIKAAGEKQLENFKVLPTEGKIANVRELANPSVVKSFDVKEVFNRAEVDKIIDLDPTKPGRFEAGVLQNDLTGNIKALTEGVFGATLSGYIDNIVNERIGGVGSHLSDSLREYIAQNIPSGTVPPHPERNQLVADAIKIALLRDPANAQNIINVLANDAQIDLNNIPGFQDALKERVVKHIVDGNAKENPTFFNSAIAGGANAAQVKENRRKIADQLLVAPAGAVVLVNLEKGVPIAVTSVQVTKLSTIVAFGAIDLFSAPSINLDPIPVGGVPASTISGCKNDAFKGLEAHFANPQVKALVKDLSKALTRNGPTSKTLFENIYQQGILVGGDATKSKLDRYTAFATAYRYIVDNKAGASHPASLNTMEAKLEQFALPERILQNTQKALLESVTTMLGGLAPLPAELASLNVATLRADIEQALSGKSLDPSLMERLSMIAAGVNDGAKRKEMLSNLRAIANLEVIKEIAKQAAGSDTDAKYQQYLMALVNRFVFRDSGDPTNPVASSEIVSKQLMSILYAGDKDAAITSINILSNGPLKNYLRAVLPTSATIEQKLELKGLSSTGEAYAKAHELFGIVRRGQEAGEINALKGQTQPQKEAFLVANFGFTAGTPELLAAVTRLDQVIATAVPADGSMNLTQIIDAAAGNKPTTFGTRYSNMERMYRAYIENGGNLVDIMRNSETLQANSFLQAIQEQANAETGATQGGVMTEGNRVMTVEEQRTAILADYEALGARSGLRGWVDRIKRVLPRIGKAIGFMALATAATMFPPAAGLAAVAFGAMRVIGVVAAVKMGVPLFKQAWNDGNWKAGIAAGLAIGVNVAVNAFVPTPLGYGLTLLGESVATEVYADRNLSNEVKAMKTAHDNYDTALGHMLASLDVTNADDVRFIEKTSRAIGIDVVRDAAGQVDLVQTVPNIISARDAAHTDKNMTLLRSFSQVVEERMATQITTLNVEHLKAKKAYNETQQNIMAYAVASGATKLGFGIAKGFSIGYENAGFFGGLAGALGWSVGGEGETNTLDRETSENLTGLHSELESDFDKHAQSLGVSSQGNNVVAMVHTYDGDHVALIDLDGNPETVEMVVDIDNIDFADTSKADLDFKDTSIVGVSSDVEVMKSQVAILTGSSASSVQITNPPAGADGNVVSIVGSGSQTFAIVNGGAGQLHLYTTNMTGIGGAEGLAYNESATTIAVAGDSQWSLIEDTFRAAMPGHSDQAYFTATANALNEAGTGKVYEEIYANRDASVNPGRAVQINDRITIDDIKAMAPNAFEKIASTNATGTSSTGGASSTSFSLGDRVDVGPTELGDGLVVFDPTGNGSHIVIGNMMFTTTTDDPSTGMGGASDDSSSQGSTTETTTTPPVQDDTSKDPNWLQSEWGKFVGAVNSGSAAGGSTGSLPQNAGGAGGFPSDEISTNGISSDTFMVTDPKLGANFPVFEDTVAKILIPQGRYEGAPAFELDPSKVDIQTISDKGITYIKADGTEDFIPATSGIQLVFVGNEDNPVDIASGRQNILTIANDAARGMADKLTYANEQINEGALEVNRAAAGGKELLGTINASLGEIGKPVYDPGYTGTGNAILSHTGEAGFIQSLMGNDGQFVTNDTQQPAWMEAVAVKTGDGEGVVVPLEHVYRVGEDYIQYRDTATNNVVTVNGTEVHGVGFTYQDNNGVPKMNIKEPYIWDFDPLNPSVPSIEKVENPWWFNDVIELLPVR